MWTYNYSDELCHHGIKGQKWGVRRYQNKDGSLTEAGKKRYERDDIVLSKGSAVSHISINSNKLDLENRPTYVTTNKKDFKIYAGTFGSALYGKQVNQGNKNPSVSIHLLTAKEDVKIAGERAQKEVFNKLFKRKNQLVVEAMRRDYNIALMSGHIKGNTPYEDFSKDKNRMFSLFKSSAMPIYLQHVAGTSETKTTVLDMHFAKEVVDVLTNRNYGGILDLNDKGVWFGAESPVAILNGKKYLEDSYVKELPLSVIMSANQDIKNDGGKNMQKDLKHSIT